MKLYGIYLGPVSCKEGLLVRTLFPFIKAGREIKLYLLGKYFRLDSH